MPGIIHHFSEQARDRLNRHCLRATAALWLRSRLRDVPVKRFSAARRDSKTLMAGGRLEDDASYWPLAPSAAIGPRAAKGS
jgi:hypothetical protein